MNEQKLAARLAQTDTQTAVGALGEVIGAYSRYVRTVVFNFSRGTLTPEDADELTADVFYKLWEARGSIDPALGIRAYLSAAARNAVKDRFRKRTPPVTDIEDSELADGFLVENIAELRAMTDCLYDGLELLPKLDRKIFFRYYFYGESSPQIAKTLKLTEGAVYTRLSRARQKLRNYLNERGYDHV